MAKSYPERRYLFLDRRRVCPHWLKPYCWEAIIVLVAVLAVLAGLWAITEVTAVPVVYVSPTTGACLAVVDERHELMGRTPEESCRNLPSRFDTTYADERIREMLAGSRAHPRRK